MSFKYINPGYANLLDLDSGITVKDPQYSRTGVSFWQTESRGVITLEEAPIQMYAKFDVYPMSGERLDVRAYLTCGDSGVCIRCYGSKWSVSGIILSSTYFSDDKHIVPDSVNTIFLHVKEGYQGESCLRVLVNGYEIGNKTNIAFSFYGRKYIDIESNSDKILFSNIIISDEEFSRKEEVISLPVTDTKTDMACLSDGSYMATAKGQQLLQMVDVEQLAAMYGGDSEVTGLAVAGNPAYRTAEGLSSLTAISEEGGVITEHGIHELITDTNAGVVDSRSVSMRLSDRASKRFGWRAG